jgi:hypothetical protein
MLALTAHNTLRQHRCRVIYSTPLLGAAFQAPAFGGGLLILSMVLLLQNNNAFPPLSSGLPAPERIKAKVRIVHIGAFGFF